MLEESEPVWEAALAEENRRALDEGWQVAQQEGVVESVVSPEDQRKFDELYLEDAHRNAALLSRYGIDGDKVFALARSSITDGGEVRCAGTAP